MKIQVQPTLLQTSANKIDEYKLNYQKVYLRLYQCIENMGNSWSGKDNIAYVTQIKSFQKDFQKMVLVMNEYAEFLRQSAKAYQTTQNDRAVKAKSITI